jgi:hypothetical protein
MIEPQFNVRVPDEYYAPLTGPGRWCDLPGAIGIMWTNDAAGLDIIRMDWRETAQETLDAVTALRYAAMAQKQRPKEFFDSYSKGVFYSGLLEKDLLNYVNTNTIYDTENTKYYRNPKTKAIFKITDTQPFQRKQGKWVPLVEESDIMGIDLEEIDYKTVLYYDSMI